MMVRLCLVQRDPIAAHKPLIVLFRLLGCIYAEQPTRCFRAFIFNGKDFVEAAEVADLELASNFCLLGKLLGTHPVPEHGGLLVHFLQVSVSLHPLKHSRSVILSDTQQAEGVEKDFFFYFVVKLRISLKAGRLIDLKQPRLHLLVNEHIEAKHFKAHVERLVIRLAHSIVVLQVRLDRQQCFYY